MTMLTSLDDAILLRPESQSDQREQVTRLAALARDAGLDGIVCSGAEVGLRATPGPRVFSSYPGVRPAGRDVADQKRVVTPRAAIDYGASILVIGRPITAPTIPAPPSGTSPPRSRWTSARRMGLAGREMTEAAMSWLSRVRSGIPFLPKRQSADNLWHKCSKCGSMVFIKEWEDNLRVCPRCDHHDRIGPQARFEQLFDRRRI